jgi:hypothetical protein
MNVKNNLEPGILKCQKEAMCSRRYASRKVRWSAKEEVWPFGD